MSSQFALVSLFLEKVQGKCHMQKQNIKTTKNNIPAERLTCVLSVLQRNDYEDNVNKQLFVRLHIKFVECCYMYP